MIETINLPLILTAALVASLSPGPATLAIASTSMSSGRKFGLALASGITCGSLMWSIAAALGLSSIMAANAWAFEIVRYFGAAYLIYLAIKSAKSALSKKKLETNAANIRSLKRAFLKGLGLHLTNPKAILFFGSLYALGIPTGSSPNVLMIVILAIGIQSFLVFHAYAFLFASKPMTKIYISLRRWFEGAFAILFGVAGFKILTAKLS